MPDAARGGVCTPSATPSRPRHEFAFAAGYSPSSPTLIGTAEDRRLLLAGVNYGYTCLEGKTVSLSYSAGAMPAVVLLQPPQRSRASHAVYGFGVTPVGFLAVFFPTRRLHPVAELAGGIVASTEPIPLAGNNASGLNFLFYLGGGVRWDSGPRSAVTLGYRFLHISNAGTTNFNPGVDNNVFYLGYSFRR